MSRVTQVSNYAAHINMVRNVSTNQKVIDDLSTQLATGKKSVKLDAYGVRSKELLDLRTNLVQRQTLVQNIDTASPRLKAYDKILTQMENIAGEMTSNAVFPNGPGPARVDVPYNADPGKMKLSVNTDASTFTQNATYAVTAVPSSDGRPNSFDITVSDGLGGRSVRTVELKAVPPSDGYRFNFKIDGGPGSGSVLNLTFDTLKSASSSSFKVTYPDTTSVRDRVDATFQEIRALLNERVGDRFIFSGNRLGTEPVADPAPAKQVSVVTLNGSVGEGGEVYSVVVNGRRFSYTTQGLNGAQPEADMNTITRNLMDQINTARPPLPVIASTGNSNAITLTAKSVKDSFTVEGDVFNTPETYNSVSHQEIKQQATSTLPQVSSFKFVGPTIDAGDRYGLSVTFGVPGRWDYNTRGVDFQVTTKNINDLPGMTRMDMATTRLAEAINSEIPAPPFTARVAGTPGDLRLEIVGKEPGKPFTVQPNIRLNGNIHNTVTVATLPPGTTSEIPENAVKPPYLPDYDSQFNEDFPHRPNAPAWDTSRITAQDGIDVNYGITSNDPAFQKLIRAFRTARAAVDNPGDYTEMMLKTKALLAESKAELRSLHAKVAVDQSTLDSIKIAHEQEISDLTGRIAGIEGIDQNQVAATLRQSMNTIEASYTVAGRAARLSLVNYLT